MWPNLLPLYLASIACITLMALFARHNRKTGWIRERKSILRDLIALQMHWDDSDTRTTADPLTGSMAPSPAAQAGHPSVLQPITRSPQKEAFEFTRQLAGMAQGLRRSASEPIGAVEEESAKVTSRVSSGD
jgi:hypothetical protein